MANGGNILKASGISGREKRGKGDRKRKREGETWGKGDEKEERKRNVCPGYCK